ncbi:class I tRNA ligase family protein [Paraburkholderia sp. RL17-347-BIC-D]|uniref:class I tRNA ligase family protein n=1 Tax=Paraburkholderia sp. RL17-347-BIC-D TaxID=3031632 RepID=UPI0038B6CE61
MIAADTPSAAARPAPYQPASLEPHWQRTWQDARVFEADRHRGRPKWFVIELPPFATGRLHLGHARNYVLADAGARFRRMQGYDVLYTSGFDTFGLPIELAASAEGCMPGDLASRCSDAMGEQFVRLGLGHDRRRIDQYHVPEFYRWVQWVFVRLFEAGYCFRRDAAAAWCAQCEVTLAASLVEDGRCWRCKGEVQTQVRPQWFVRESAFADEMLDGLDRLDGWPHDVKMIHRDWIGRRDGVQLSLPLRGRTDRLSLLLEDPAWVSDLRFIAVGRQHPLAAASAMRLTPGETLVLPDVAQAAGEAGIFDLPIVVEDAAHDGARPGRPGPVPEDRALAELNGIAWSSHDASGPIDRCDAQAMLAAGQASRVVRYRLQDWNIARNRYWGPPVPVVHCADCGLVAVPEHELPVLLPDDVDLQQSGNPLERHCEFRHVACPRCNRPAMRDPETLEAYSSPWWYHWLCRSLDAEYPFSREDAQAWLPVDLMIGGADQVRSCFFHVRMIARALRRLGIADIEEPVTTLLALGMVKQNNRKMSKSAGNAVDMESIIARYGTDTLRLAIIGAAAPERDFNWSEELARREHAFLARAWHFVHGVCALIGDRRHVSDDAVPTEAGSAVADGALDRLGKRMEGWLATGGYRMTADLRRHDYHLALRNLKLLFDRLQTFDVALRKHQPPRAQDVAILADATRAMVLYLGPLAPHIAEALWQTLDGEGMVACAAWPAESDSELEPSGELEGMT